MKHLVIVHLEPMFENTAGSLDKLVNKVKSHANLYDKVLNITSADTLGAASYPQLKDFESEEWIWGFDAAYYQEEEPDKWIEGKNFIKVTTAHQYAEINDWMYQLPKSASYTLVGGGRDECLQDIYEIFQHLSLKVKINEKLTY